MYTVTDKTRELAEKPSKGAELAKARTVVFPKLPSGFAGGGGGMLSAAHEFHFGSISPKAAPGPAGNESKQPTFRQMNSFCGNIGIEFCDQKMRIISC